MNNNTIIAFTGPAMSGKSLMLDATRNVLRDRHCLVSVILAGSSPVGISQMVQEKDYQTILVDDDGIGGDEWAVELLNSPLIKSVFKTRKIIRIEVL